MHKHSERCLNNTMETDIDNDQKTITMAKNVSYKLDVSLKIQNEKREKLALY